MRTSTLLFFILLIGCMKTVSTKAAAFVPSVSRKQCKHRLDTTGHCDAWKKSRTTANDFGQVTISDKTHRIMSPLVTQPTTTSTILEVSNQASFEPEKQHEPEHKESWFEKGMQKVATMLPQSWTKGGKDEETNEIVKETRWAKRERLRQRKALGKEMRQLLRPLPLPFRTMGNMIVSGTDRILQKEGRKVEPHLKRAQKLLNHNKGAIELLGKPLIIRNVISQSTSTTNINGKKKTNVQLTFEVMGTKENAVATMLAEDKEIVSLDILTQSGFMDKVK